MADIVTGSSGHHGNPVCKKQNDMTTSRWRNYCSTDTTTVDIHEIECRPKKVTENSPQTPNVPEIKQSHGNFEIPQTTSVQEAERIPQTPSVQKKERTQQMPSVYEVKRTPQERSVQDRKNTTVAVGKKKKDSQGDYCDWMEWTPRKSSVQEAELHDDIQV